MCWAVLHCLNHALARWVKGMLKTEQTTGFLDRQFFMVVRWERFD